MSIVMLAHNSVASLFFVLFEGFSLLILMSFFFLTHHFNVQFVRARLNLAGSLVYVCWRELNTLRVCPEIVREKTIKKKKKQKSHFFMATIFT